MIPTIAAPRKKNRTPNTLPRMAPRRLLGPEEVGEVAGGYEVDGDGDGIDCPVVPDAVA